MSGKMIGMMKPPVKSSKLGIHLLMVLTIFLAATSFPVVALITHALPPAILMLLRFVLAALLFAPFALRKSSGGIPSVNRLLRYMVLSIPSVIFFWCMFESLRYTSILNTGALYTLVPALVALYAYLINKEPVGKLRMFGIVVGTTGALWIVFRGDVQALIGLEVNRGDLLFLIGCFAFALYNPLLKRLYQGEPMMVLTFWILIWGSLFLFLLSLPHLNRIDWRGVDRSIYGGIVYLTICCTFITFYLVNYSTVRIGPTQVAAYGLLTPLFIILISLLLQMETFDQRVIPGIILILGSMVLIQLEMRKQS